LYDLSTDIGEKNDLSLKEANMFSKVNEKFNQWQEEMEKAEPRGPFRNY
jgi:hypothetical protein